jgi:hypothetical protein
VDAFAVTSSTPHSDRSAFVLVIRGRLQDVFDDRDKAVARAEQKGADASAVHEFAIPGDHPDDLPLMSARLGAGWEFVGAWNPGKTFTDGTPTSVRLEHFRRGPRGFTLVSMREFEWGSPALKEAAPFPSQTEPKPARPTTESPAPPPPVRNVSEGTSPPAQPLKASRNMSPARSLASRKPKGRKNPGKPLSGAPDLAAWEEDAPTPEIRSKELPGLRLPLAILAFILIWSLGTWRAIKPEPSIADVIENSRHNSPDKLVIVDRDRALVAWNVDKASLPTLISALDLDAIPMRQSIRIPRPEGIQEWTGSPVAAGTPSGLAREVFSGYFKEDGDGNTWVLCTVDLQLIGWASPESLRETLARLP